MRSYSLMALSGPVDETVTSFAGSTQTGYRESMKPVLPGYMLMFSSSLQDICSSITYLQKAYYVPGTALDDGNNREKSSTDEERSTD